MYDIIKFYCVYIKWKKVFRNIVRFLNVYLDKLYIYSIQVQEHTCLKRLLVTRVNVKWSLKKHILHACLENVTLPLELIDKGVVDTPMT